MIYVNVRAFIIREHNGGDEILVQRRIKAHEPDTPMELPGGRLEKFEPFFTGLKREIKEETGLELEQIIDQTNLVQTTSEDGFRVECLKPFAVYQTTEGPVDSMGVYFRCRANGELLKRGDETDQIQWVTIDELKRLLADEQLSWVDQAGVKFYLQEYL